METTPAKQAIDDRGGYRAVAEALTKRTKKRVPPTTVHTWYLADKLPPWREEAVLALPKVKRKARAA